MIWMAVTADQYELPMIVEPTSVLLDKKLGIAPNSVRSKERRKENGIHTGYRIIRIKEENNYERQLEIINFAAAGNRERSPDPV